MSMNWIQVDAADQPGPDNRADGLQEPYPHPLREHSPADDVPMTEAGSMTGAGTAKATNVDQYAIGGGWYQFDDGTKVQGRDQAEAHLASA